MPKWLKHEFKKMVVYWVFLGGAMLPFKIFGFPFPEWNSDTLLVATLFLVWGYNFRRLDEGDK